MALNTSDPEAVRRAADDIVSAPAFTRHEHSRWQQVLDYVAHPWKAIDPIFNWIADQFSGSGAAPFIAWTFAGLLVIGAVALLVWLTRSTSSDSRVPVTYAPDARGKTAGDWLREASTLEAEGRWREAVRARYAALVAELAERGVVRPRPGCTTGEYLRQVEANLPDATPPFREATTLFEQVWYGTLQPSQTETSRLVQLSSAVTQRAAA